MQHRIFDRLGLANGWVQETAWAAITLAVGFGLMPMLIFLAGSTALGRYDGASAGGIYAGVYHGLAAGSAASWIVVLGPYGLYLAFRALAWTWRASASIG